MKHALPINRDAHVHIPFHLDGGFSEDDRGRIEFSIRISLRAVFGIALTLNVVAIPIVALWQHLMAAW